MSVEYEARVLEVDREKLEKKLLELGAKKQENKRTRYWLDGVEI